MMSSKKMDYLVLGSITKITGALSCLVRNRPLIGTLGIVGSDVWSGSPIGSAGGLPGSPEAAGVPAEKGAASANGPFGPDNDFRIRLTVDTAAASGELVALITRDWTSIEIISLDLTNRHYLYSFLVKCFKVTATACRLSVSVEPAAPPVRDM